jgi:hypothetical protein
MIRSLKVQGLVDWFLANLDVWEVPVTVRQLAAVDSGWSRDNFVAAIKFLAAAELIYKYSEGNRGLIHWLPTRLRPVCPIQVLICKGRLT